MHSQDWDGRLHITYKNYCVVNIERICQNYKDAASELGDATDVTYATCMTSVAEPGQGNRSTLQQKLCSLQPVVVFSGLSVM